MKQRKPNPTAVAIALIIGNLLLVAPWFFGADVALKAYSAYALIFVVVILIGFYVL